MHSNVWSITLLCTLCTTLSLVSAAGELNDDCLVVHDCRNFGYYCGANRTCQCLPGEYIPNKYGDKCVGLLDRTCKYDEHCLEGGFCKEQRKCTCKEGLFATKFDTKCSNSSWHRSAEAITLPVLLVLLVYLNFCDWMYF